MTADKSVNLGQIISRDILKFYLEKLSFEYGDEDESFIDRITPGEFDIFVEEGVVGVVIDSIESYLLEHLSETDRIPSDEDALDTMSLEIGKISSLCEEEFKFNILQREGGGEGGAEDCSVVVSFRDKFYQCDFAYYSYHGYEFGNSVTREVVPREVTVVKYFSV